MLLHHRDDGPQEPDYGCDHGVRQGEDRGGRGLGRHSFVTRRDLSRCEVIAPCVPKTKARYPHVALEVTSSVGHPQDCCVVSCNSRAQRVQLGIITKSHCHTCGHRFPGTFSYTPGARATRNLHMRLFTDRGAHGSLVNGHFGLAEIRAVEAGSSVTAWDLRICE